MPAIARDSRLSLSLSLLPLLAMGATGCLSNDHLLVGENGREGSGSGGTVGGNDGGTGGAVAPRPTIDRLQHPLPIPAQEALTRMAAVIWSAPPDADLLSQAAAGHIVTIEDLYGPARQMLADPRAAKGVGAFYDWWLKLPTIDGLTKDATRFPSFNSQLAADMHSEVLAFALGVTLDMNGTFETLLTAPFSFVNARLADVYGLSGITGDNLRQVSLNPAERAGLLTLPGLQAQSSNPDRNNPPRRGKAVFESLVCNQIPPPPANTPEIALPLPTGTTLRQALAMNEKDPACLACHRIFDPYGLVFETFDAIGRARTTDNDAPVDVSNLEVNLDGGMTINGGAIELAKVLGQSESAQLCMARQWLAFALKLDSYGSLQIVDAVVDQMIQPVRASGFVLKELIVALLLSDAFLAP